MNLLDLPVVHRNRFQPLQLRILGYLSDGLAHSKQDVIKHCFNDPETEANALHQQVFHIRKALPPSILLITEARGRQTFLRLARHFVIRSDE